MQQSWSSGGLPVEPGAIPLVLSVSGHVTVAADSQAGDDGHLLEERHGGGESYHLLGNDSLTSPEEGHHPFTPTGSCRLAIGLDILMDGWT